MIPVSLAEVPCFTGSGSLGTGAMSSAAVMNSDEQ